MGVPPTIPNFDELMDKGIDYLATAVAEETGMPGSDVATKLILEQMAAEMAHKPNPVDPLGIQLDPAYQYQSAVLMIEIRNNDPTNRTPPGSFRITDSRGLLLRAPEPPVPAPPISRAMRPTAAGAGMPARPMHSASRASASAGMAMLWRTMPAWLHQRQRTRTTAALPV